MSRRLRSRVSCWGIRRLRPAASWAPAFPARSPSSYCRLIARNGCVSPEERGALEESLRARMEEVNAQLDPHERLNFIAIVEGPWTIGNERITPTLKIKRAAVEARYQPLVNEWERLNRSV